MRYLPLTDTDRQAMLATIGAATVDDLFVDVPEVARLDGFLNFNPAVGRNADDFDFLDGIGPGGDRRAGHNPHRLS